MPESTAFYETANGSKYLTQLCKHFAHKIEVTHDEREGRCVFQGAIGLMKAEDNGLRMTVEAPDAESLERAQSIIEVHLGRFAWREEMGALDWVRAPDAA
ncbi:DUF2218 domain-containing protein [Hoeflea olei]|uniref:2,4-dihydroxyhept-2-ene-1,7-dioic acid aldolase n=1 Tax=Hoeflea olei TaxID=1480615 RepID=A0A1C1YV33_9HYPH|nr:DUF2218 domain-containing protein [Hoeflea olei]OCW57384.1 2,4-dihydroxyhept-2-ene-1,7-dioic acid aldolase [Hoeflea olei]